ncbi:MAG: cell division protein FtsZ [Bacteroidota bacterium]|nr:cell division protein FtsZ [Bacteroidota bacterium]
MEILKFETPKENSSIIKVMGVGGGGSNAVNFMYKQGISGVDFVICNTDLQALENSPVPYKIQIGRNLTLGRGAGANAEVGKNAAIESIDEIKDFLNVSTRMLFITAGMGGGTGTGAAPVIAQIAKELDILTVGIVTIPFGFEGRKKRIQAEAGINELKQYVDTIIIINNDKIRELYGNLSFVEAFSKADNVLTTAAKGIAEIITIHGMINVDFEDVKSVMSNGGIAIMGSAEAEGENKAIKAVTLAIASPLLNYNQIKGASKVLVNISSGEDAIITMDEMSEINEYIQEQAGNTADIIMGVVQDNKLGSKVAVTVVATNFESTPDVGIESKPVKVVLPLEDNKVKAEVEKPQPQPIVQQEPVSEVPAKEDFHIKISPVDQEPKTIIESLNIEPIAEPAVMSDIKTADEICIKESSSVIEEPKETPKQVPTVIKEFSVNNSTQILEKQPQVTDKSLNIQNEDKQISGNTTSLNNLGSKLVKERTRERMKELQKQSLGISSDPNSHNYNDDIENLEKIPAYLRNGVEIKDKIHSSDKEVSRYTLSSDNEGNVQLRENNSFLHDKVD